MTNADNLQEFCDLINAISLGPDADRRLEEVRQILKIYADEDEDDEFPSDLAA